MDNLLNKAFEYVILTSKKYNIDESHALKHSLEVFTYAKNILNSEIELNPILNSQKEIIYLAVILHDMADKKYMNEEEGIYQIRNFLKNFVSDLSIDIICKIISTMSYSTVKKNGFPHLAEYQLAYNIVREADLLAAYDIDRCIIYGLMVDKMSYIDAMIRTKELFINRVLNYRNDNLFILKYSQNISLILHNNAIDGLKKYYVH
jgi:HD superfamily phosphodiesterase